MIRFFSFILLNIFIVHIGLIDAYSSDKKFKILLFGDSIIAGYGLPSNDSLPKKLEDYLEKEDKNVSVINAGVSGDTTSGGVSRLKWTLEKYNPDLLFIGLGGNDMLRGISPKVVRRNIEEMIKIANEFGVKTIINEVQASPSMGIFYKNEFDNIYEDINDRYDVDTYPFLLEITFGKAGLMQPDNIHPSVKGVDSIVEEFGPYIIEYIK